MGIYLPTHNSKNRLWGEAGEREGGAIRIFNTVLVHLALASSYVWSMILVCVYANNNDDDWLILIVCQSWKCETEYWTFSSICSGPTDCWMSYRGDLDLSGGRWFQRVHMKYLDRWVNCLLLQCYWCHNYYYFFLFFFCSYIMLSTMKRSSRSIMICSCLLKSSSEADGYVIGEAMCQRNLHLGAKS